MRVSAFLGIVVLAGLGGYAISRLQDSPVSASVEAGRGAIAGSEMSATAASGAKANGDKQATEAGARASFVADVPNTATMSAAPALPPESLPLMQSAAQLIELMRGGSREATLRLLRQTEQCELYGQGRLGLDLALGLSEAAQNPQSQENSVAILFNGNAGEKTQLETMTEGAAGLMAKHEQQCAGFTDPDDRLRFEAQWRAALLGELEGLILFSVNPAIDLKRAIEQGDRIERYRERALSFLTQAMALHSAQAVAQLMEAFDPEWIPPPLRAQEGKSIPPGMRAMLADGFPPPPLRQLAGNDAQAAYRYAQLCERICPDLQRSAATALIARLRGTLEGPERERAEIEAQRLREQYFPDAGRADWVEIPGESGNPTSSAPGTP
jgi:hypothetical protein